ncbi:MAG TPA: type II secretion system F family protein [Tepidiformaceae bacterium]|nr:type II secretion system F family protein [Tepidiformaceae bacterium]
MLFLIFLLVFVATTLTVIYVARPREDPVARRLGTAPVHDVRVRQLEAGAGQRLVLPIFRSTGRTVGRLLPHNLVRHVDRMLLAADQPWSLQGFLASWLLAAGSATAIALYLATTSKSLSPLQATLFSGLIIAMGASMPYMLLRRKAKNRQKAIMLALPNALDLLVTCVEAGIAVDSAFALVTEKMSGPISETFATYLRQVGLGRPRREALSYIAHRTGLPDLINLSAAVNQAEELGTTMGDVLRLQAEELRAARRERAQTAAQRAPVLMTIPLTVCFMPAMAAVVVVPSILNFIHFFGTIGS